MAGLQNLVFRKAFWRFIFFFILVNFLPINNDVSSAGLFSDYKNAHSAFNERRYSEALEICNRVLSQAALPSSVRSKILAGRGLVYERLGQWNSAMKDYNQAAQLSPNLCWAYIGYGNVLMALSEYKEAISEFNRALSIERQNTTAIYRRGNCHFLSNNLYDASDDYSKVLRINPQHRYAKIMFYLTGLRSGKNFSTEHVDDHTELESDWPNPILAFYSGQLKPDDLLLKAVDKNIVKEREKKSEAYFHIGQYYVISGDYEKAKQAFTSCVNQNINYYMEYRGAQAELIHLTGLNNQQ